MYKETVFILPALHPETVKMGMTPAGNWCATFIFHRHSADHFTCNI